MPWMDLRYPGKCQCGAPVAARQRAFYDGTRVLKGCPACGGAAGAGTQPPQQASTALAPTGPVAPRPERAVVEPPSVGAAQRALASHLARLDPDQALVAAIRAPAGAPGLTVFRALAGAGSGKTTALVGLVGSLVGEGADPAGIIAVTYTRKGGDEMRQRLARVLPPGTLSKVRHCGTYDSLAVRTMAGRDPARWSMDRCVNVAGRDAPVPGAGLLWDAILTGRKEGVPGTGAKGLELENPEVAAYTLAVDVARAAPLTDREIDARVAASEVKLGLRGLSEAWAMYQAAKRALGAWDFLDARHAFYRALTAGEVGGAAFVAVDEAQDNSPLDLACAVALASKPGAALVLIGDVRQAIFEWRGGAPEILATADTVLGARTLTLARNYRSGTRIVAAANLVADGQAWSVGATALAARDVEGTITLDSHADPMEAAEAAAEAILEEGGDLTRHAILTRTNAASGIYEAALLRAGIPCAVVGGSAFFARREVKDALAYLTLSESDDAEALARAVKAPRTFLGKAYLDGVAQTPGDLPARVLAAARFARGSGVANARLLAAFLRDLREEPSLAVRALKVATRLASGGHDVGGADEERGALARALAQIAARFPSVAALKAFAARCEADVVSVGEDADAPAGRVTISTIHKSKGREWETVYLDATGGAFPHSRSLEDPRRAAEERRLFYVAVTRAKDRLALTWCHHGLNPRQGGPSPFLGLVEATVGPKGPQGPQGGGEPAPRVEVDVTPAAPAAPALPALTAGEAVEVGSTPASVGSTPASSEDAALTDSEGGTGWAPEVWAAALAVAQAGTAAEPESREGAGGRYVQPQVEDFATVLGPLGFTAREEAGQVVFVAQGPSTHGTAMLKVYTSIPCGEDAAREVGEDSIKVAALWQQTGDPQPFPMHKRLPYAARTRGWRLAVLRKVGEVSRLFHAGSLCPKCGAPTVERAKRDGSGTFRGCVRWSRCSR